MIYFISSPDGPIKIGTTIRLLSDDHVLIPYQWPRHPRTGLNKRGAAVCSWIEWIDEDRVIRPVGFVPSKQLLAIARILERIAPEGESTDAGTQT